MPYEIPVDSIKYVDLSVNSKSHREYCLQADGYSAGNLLYGLDYKLAESVYHPLADQYSGPSEVDTAYRFVLEENMRRAGFTVLNPECDNALDNPIYFQGDIAQLPEFLAPFLSLRFQKAEVTIFEPGIADVDYQRFRNDAESSPHAAVQQMVAYALLKTKSPDDLLPPLASPGAVNER